MTNDSLLDPSQFKPRFPNEAELQKAGYIKRSFRQRDINIISAPRVGAAYWIDFAHDHYEPEFCGEHPGVVIRAVSKLSHGTCIVVPLSTRKQDDLPYIHKLRTNPSPKGRSDGKVAYAVCDHIYTVHVNRLRPFRNTRGNVVFPRVDEPDLQAIFGAVRAAMPWLVQIPVSDEQPAAAGEAQESAEAEGRGKASEPGARRAILSLPTRPSPAKT